MKNEFKGSSPFVWILYGVMLILTFGLLLISREKYKIESPIEQQYKESISMIDDWIDEDGDVVNLVKLHYNKKVKAGKEYWLYHSIPINIKEGFTLNISAINVYYQLYVDGTLLVDVYNPDGQEVKNSFGQKYSIIPIEKRMAGKTLKMKLIPVYNDINATFLDITLGLPQGYLLQFAKEKLISFATSIFFLLVSILLVLLDIPINMKKEKNHELLALGLFSFVVGMWGLMSTHFMEYFTGDGRTTQIAACLFLTLIMSPLLSYIRNGLGLFSYIEVNIYGIIYFVAFLIVWILQATNKVDVQSTLILTHIMLGVGCLILVSLFFHKKYRSEVKKVSKTYLLFRVIGLVSLVIGAVIEFVRYYLGYVEDNAIFVRFGLLLFIMCFGVASLEKTIRAVKMGFKAEFISQLAYEDGLTNLSNRTAFNERLEMIEMKQHNVAIIMFDVNDLKKVNDNLGHQYGDEMLVSSAKLIKNTFGAIGGF